MQADPNLMLMSKDGREQLWLRRVREPGGEEVLEIRGVLKPGVTGPPLHIHYGISEETAVHQGMLGVLLSGKEFVVKAGEITVFPPGSAHRWWNAGRGSVEFSGRAVPAGDLDRYLQGVFDLVNASPSGKPALFHMAHLLWRHRHTHALVVPPVAVQWIILPLVVLLGTVLGKYRGKVWPGSPDRCYGAPVV